LGFGSPRTGIQLRLSPSAFLLPSPLMGEGPGLGVVAAVRLDEAVQADMPCHPHPNPSPIKGEGL